jgi:LuxR family transcriptional regulator, maltose regulon positive regulatory protein
MVTLRLRGSVTPLTFARKAAVRNRTARDDTHIVTGLAPATRDALAISLAVLPARLDPPYQRPGIVARARLVERIAGCETPMIAIVAPAGYGKSTVLAEIAHNGEGRVAWLSADQRDDDPATFLRDIAAAIHRVAPLTPVTIGRVTSPGPSVWSGAVASVAAALREAVDLRLVIDDIDRIDNPASIDVLLALIDDARAAGRIMIAGRFLGRIPGARLASRGVLTTIERDELALDADEAVALVRATGIDLAPDDIDRIRTRTEGWAAGIYLSTLAADAAEPPSLDMSAVGPGRMVEEYLRTEVVGAMAADERDMLLACSVLDRLSGPLCDRVLERRRSGAVLDRMERTNLFVIALDPERTWYRVHRLLGDFLRAELERTDPERAAALRRRAAAWHEDHGLREAALEYAMAAGDEERAAELTVQLGQPATNEGRTETVSRWFSWFDERSAGPRHPRLAGYASMVFALIGDSTRAERWADVVDDLYGRDLEPADTGLLAIARSMLGRHGLSVLVTDAETAVGSIGEGDRMRVAALAALGLARSQQGDTGAATEVMREAVARWERAPGANAAVTFALTSLGADALANGDRATAQGHVRQARQMLASHGLADQAMAIGIDALDARISLMHGAVAQAQADLAHAQRLRPRLGHVVPWLAIRARLDLSRAHLAMDDSGGARTLMAEVDDILLLRPDMGALLVERDELARQLREIRGGSAGASTLTMAELRVLPLLTTHLSFREIGERLFVSQNTVKTQAISIYRKLDATSRSEAVERSIELGLLESAGPADRFIPAG